MKNVLFSIVVLASLAIFQTEAHAFSFEVVELLGCESPDPSSGCFGETITIGVRVDNPSALEIAAVKASVTGYDPTIAAFNSGQAVGSVFNELCIPTVGCFGGISNTAPPLSQSTNVTSGQLEIPFLQGVTLTPTSGDGSFDPGLDAADPGIPDASPHFRFSFVISSPGETTLQIGFDAAYGNSLFASGGIDISPPDANALVFLSSEQSPYVVPEPGTALLIGLGLAVLSATRRPQAAWVDEVVERGGQSTEFSENCTPGYYNNEGTANLKNRQGSFFIGGPTEFADRLKAWRAAEEFEGLEVRT
jgi:hypothetical protein